MRTSTQLRAGAGAGWMPTSAPRRPTVRPGGHDGHEHNRPRRGQQDGSRWLTGRGPRVAPEAAVGRVRTLKIHSAVHAGGGGLIDPNGHP